MGAPTRVGRCSGARTYGRSRSMPTDRVAASILSYLVNRMGPKSTCRRRQTIEHVRAKMPHVSERRACRVLNQRRATQRHTPQVANDEAPLTNRIVEMACEYGRYGYRRVTALLRQEGWQVNHKRVERIWRREGLKVPQKQPKRGRLWFNDGSCIRLRPQYPDHVWAYDFVSVRTHDGRPLRLLVIVDEHTRECLSIDIARRLNSEDVLERLAWLFVTRGVPEHIRSDNGPEFTAEAVRAWLKWVGVRTLFIEPGSPWENGYVESFNGKLRDELLTREIFYTLTGPKCSSNDGVTSTTRCGRIARWTTNPRHRRRTSPLSRAPLRSARLKGLAHRSKD